MIRTGRYKKRAYKASTSRESGLLGQSPAKAADFQYIPPTAEQSWSEEKYFEWLGAIIEPDVVTAIRKCTNRDKYLDHAAQLNLAFSL